MAFAPTSPVTGAAQTGFTSPTYTHVADTPPDANSKQIAVSALGGTQTGATVHSVSSPFTTTMWRPKQFAVLGKPHPVTGLISNVALNVYKILTRKGMLPLAAQPVKAGYVRTHIEIPAGADLADPANVKAMLSMHIGVLQQISAGIGDTALTGTL